MMETKPYNLQSPEQIAKDYGGNKQKIAEAMQMGILDPTAGTLAGMFIDRMRSAQQQEMAPQQTVAQQVFAPPMPPMPAGLGATPQAAAMAPPPQMPGAPMGAPPAPPMEAMPPQGMAMGGLTSLSLPDNMFDEPDNGGYASGGLVAFAAGTPDGVVDPNAPADPADPDVPNFEGEDLPVTGRREVPEPSGPREYYGNFRDPFLMQEQINLLAPQTTTRRDQLTAYIDRMLSPDEQKKRRQEDMWMTLGQIGARMATTPGSLLQAASTGIAEALPGVRAAAATRRTEERGARSELARNEGLSNTEARDMYRLIQEGTNRYGQFHESRLTREENARLDRYKEDQANYRAAIAAAASRYGADRGAAANMYSTDRQYQAALLGTEAEQNQSFATFMNSTGGMMALQNLMQSGLTADQATASLRAGFFGSGGGGGLSPSLPAGFVPDQN